MAQPDDSNLPALGASPEAVSQPKRKRKREREKNNKLNAAAKKLKPEPQKDVKTTSKGREAQAGKPRPQEDQKDENINEAIGHMDPQLLADYVGQKLRKFEADLSAVELEDRFIPKSCFVDTGAWSQPRTSGYLSAFIEEFSGAEYPKDALSQTALHPGEPHTLILTAAALRAAKLSREVREFQTKESKVAKLFAKHIKFQESADMCKSTRIGIGIGTPQRVLKLVQEEFIRIENLQRIVIDASAVNEKGQGLLDIKETQGPLMGLLNHPPVKALLGTQIKLLFF